MRWLLGVWVVLCLGAVVLGRPPQARARATRGFKNVALSTARGFGKRTPPDQLVPQPRLKAEWLAEEMSASPDLARLFVRRFLDTDSDGYLSAEELLARPQHH